MIITTAATAIVTTLRSTRPTIGPVSCRLTAVSSESEDIGKVIITNDILTYSGNGHALLDTQREVMRNHYSVICA